VTEFGLVELTRERVRPSHMFALSEACPCCGGLGRIISRENMATKIERWFARAKVENKYHDFHLVMSPHMASVMAENGTNRVKRIMKAFRCRLNVIWDTTLPQTEYHIYNALDNSDITEKYQV
jgi:ribonuclease G